MKLLSAKFLFGCVVAAGIVMWSVCIAAKSDMSRKDSAAIHWTQALAEKQSPYSILDSETWAEWGNVVSSFFWIDNENVIFKTVKDNDKHRGGTGPFQVSIWKINDGVKPYTPYANRVYICFRDGLFRYILEDESKNWKVFYGRFRDEKLVTQSKGTYADSINCRIADNPKIAENVKAGRRIQPLLTRHGYLDYGSAVEQQRQADKNKIVYYRAGKREPITLPITNETIRNVEYYEFKDAYLIHRFKGYRDAWWLYPDGQTEEVKFPTIPKLLADGGFFPLRNGFFVVRGSGAVDPGRRPGEAGGYLIKANGEYQKVITGYLSGTAVSPDGCKVAFSHYPYIDATRVDDPGRITLKAINFCTEEKITVGRVNFTFRC